MERRKETKEFNWKDFKKSKELTDEINKWKFPLVKTKALLTDQMIWDAFTGEDKNEHTSLFENFLEGGLKLANSVMNLDVAGGFFDAVQDLATEALIDKGYDKGGEISVAWYGMLPEEKVRDWEPWKYAAGEKDPADALCKKIGASVVAVALKVIAGATLVSAGPLAGIGIVVAFGLYLGDKADAKLRKSRQESALSAIARYSEIKWKAEQRIQARRRNQVEQILLSNAKHDFEDENPRIVGTYRDTRTGDFIGITEIEMGLLGSMYMAHSEQLPAKKKEQVIAKFHNYFKEAAWNGNNFDEGTVKKIKTYVDQLIEDELMRRGLEEAKSLEPVVASPIPDSSTNNAPSQLRHVVKQK